MKKISRSIAGIVVAFLVAIVCSLILEGAARLFLSSSGWGPVVPAIGRFDPVLGWSKKPNARGVSARTGQSIEYHTNSKGLRDDETSYEKPAGVFRIVLLGDSRAFGWGVPIEKHFSTLLEEYFNDVEVVNLGIDGFGVDQELLYLRQEGFKYQPDLVLVYVAHYANHRHMHASRFGKSKPRFELDGRELVLKDVPTRHNPASGPAGGLAALGRWFNFNSVVYQVFRNRLSRALRGHDPAEALRQQDEQNARDATFQERLHSLGEALVFAMHAEAVSSGADFLLVTEIARLRDASWDQDILCLDVSKALANPAFALPDGLEHLNESGNGVLAWEIARFIELNHLVPSTHAKRARRIEPSS